MEPIYILGGARTPMAEWSGGKTGRGAPGGALAHLTALELGAHAARAALERTATDPERIDHVVMGNALQTSADALYGARHVALRAGVPKDKPALTVNRLCGSGIEAVVQAGNLIKLGEAHTVLAGGMESLSQAPFVVRGARGGGLRMGHQPLEDMLLASLMDTFAKCYMANTAENLARDHEISREAQDEFALRSFQRAEAAIEGGIFAEEVAPVELKSRKGDVTPFEHDDHFFPNSTMEGLSKLRPAFGKDGFVTAGNASGVVDGAAALVVVGEKALPAGAKPLARVVSHAVVGVEPTRMGIGPVPAIRAALDKAKLTLDQVDRFEINEAFAAQYLAVEKELELDRDKVNVNGGAIAIGHPLAATGTRLLLTLALELRRKGLRYGVASACIGGGQGIAMVIESV